MSNKLLSILIPTYNRAHNLDTQLSLITALQKSINFKIIVSNNCSTDNTVDIVKRWQLNNDIEYFEQNENVGFDRNLCTCINLVETDYFWILGDSTIIELTPFIEINKILSSDKPNAVLINSYNKIKLIDSQYYNNPDKILYDLGWNLSHLNSIVLSKNAFNITIAERYYDTNFIHLGVMFEYFVSVKNLKVYYFNANPFIHVSQFTKVSTGTYWFQRKYEVFCEDWFFAIMSLPNQISKEAKLKCIKDHAKYNKLFTYSRVLKDRAKNIIDSNRFKNISPIFTFITVTPVWYVKLVNCIPITVFNTIRKLKSTFK